MFEIISHRGNLDGKDPTRENTIEAITGAMALGYSVEFDVRMHGDTFWFGHDYPQRLIDLGRLTDLIKSYGGTLYAHCKTIETLQHFVNQHKQGEQIVPFFHDNDECVLLRTNKIWVHPKMHDLADYYPNDTILVCPEWFDAFWMNTGFAGICTDFPNKIKSSIDERSKAKR